MRTLGRKGFSLVELVVVIVIIGILAAIAIPRLSRGTSGAGTAAVAANLSYMRQAINLYAAEHNGSYPGPDAAKFANQLTLFSDASGATNPSKTAVYKYGPYLQSIPSCPVGENAGSNAVLVDTTNSPPAVVVAGGEGWVYNSSTGELLVNSTKTDDAGKAYNLY